MGIGSLLDITAGAMLAQRMAMEVTSHNIANVNTEGYSRQVAIYETKEPSPVGGLLLGRGVEVTGIERSYNRYLNANVNDKLSAFHSFDTQRSYMDLVETIFNQTDETGLSSALGDFWGAWQDVANNPSGTAERSALVERSNILCQTFREMSEELDNLKARARDEITITVDKINDLAVQIADLNNQISGYEAGGGNANDLRDSRDRLVDELAQYVDINYFESDFGQLTIFIAGGYTLVEKTSYRTLDVNISGGGLTVEWLGNGGRKADITNSLGGGSLAGLAEMYSNKLTGYQADLDTLAESLIKEVNRQHSQGVGLSALTSLSSDYLASDSGVAMASAASGLAFYSEIDDSNQTFTLWTYDAAGTPTENTITVTPGMTLNELATALNNVTGVSASVSNGQLTINATGGGSFAFGNDNSGVLMALGLNTFFSGTSAATIGLGTAVSADTDNIAAGLVDSNGSLAPGDNQNALALVDLQDVSFNLGGSQSTFGSYLSSVVGQVGVTAAGLDSSASFNESLLSQLQAQRDSFSTVSLDEEVANLMKFQHAYQVAASLFKVADEMLGTLLEVKR